MPLILLLTESRPTTGSPRCVNPIKWFVAVEVRPVSISCRCFMINVRVFPLPSSNDDVVKVPIKVDFPASTLPMTAIRTFRCDSVSPISPRCCFRDDNDVDAFFPGSAAAGGLLLGLVVLLLLLLLLPFVLRFPQSSSVPSNVSTLDTACSLTMACFSSWCVSIRCILICARVKTPLPLRCFISLESNPSGHSWTTPCESPNIDGS
mmetsp:Transcript_6294/g.12903  ORF Transcript_6294/g.12903 Transcript_6294/m.12903 type:complete len:206 (-) Transcript_6294:145-762(-)